MEVTIERNGTEFFVDMPGVMWSVFIRPFRVEGGRLFLLVNPHSNIFLHTWRVP